MMKQRDECHDQIEAAFSQERPRIVGLCAYLSGDRSAAEDLAQETFVEAWRHIERLEDLDGAGPWLSAIARNICLRWRSQLGDEAKHLPPVQGDSTRMARTLDRLPSTMSVEFDLEREALASLLDQALGLLPAATRRALLARYIEESPYAEIAERFQVSEAAVKMRVKRGRIALARVLREDLQIEAKATLATPLFRTDGWGTTNLWCSICGKTQLDGRFDSVAGDLALRCPACYPTIGIHETRTSGTPSLFQNVENATEAYEQLINHAGTYLWNGLVHGSAPCIRCGRGANVKRELPNTDPLRTYDWRGVQVRCEACGNVSWSSLNGLLISLPAIQRFRRDHPRIRTLPEQRVEAAGQPALVIRFESQMAPQQATVVVARDTFRVLEVDIASV